MVGVWCDNNNLLTLEVGVYIFFFVYETFILNLRLLQNKARVLGGYYCI